MMQYNNWNFFAGGTIKKGLALSIDAAHCDEQHIAVMAGGGHLIGFAAKDAVAGDVVDFEGNKITVVKNENL